MHQKLYAIVDTIALDIIGPIHRFAHEAAAIRLFTDVAAKQGTMINEHPDDYTLVCLGALVLTTDDDLQTSTWQLAPEYKVVLTGTQWRAAQQQPTEA